MKLANKLVGRENVDQELLKVVIMKLEALHKKYSGTNVKTSKMAAMKGNSTKQLTKIKKVLKK